MGSSESVRIGGQPWLPQAIRALEVGDWSTAARLSRLAGGERTVDATLVAAAVRLTAHGMAAQAAGDVAAAERAYQDATASLPSGLNRSVSNGSLVQPPALAQLDPAAPSWPRRAALVLWREQELIGDLRTRLGDVRTARDYLLEACIGFVGEIEFSPFTWRPGNGDSGPLPLVDPSRKDFLCRATRLRRLVSARSGDVTESVWKDVKGYRSLRALALARLAERPLVPWSGPMSGMLPEPVRRGTLRAWEYAQTLRADLDY